MTQPAPELPKKAEPMFLISESQLSKLEIFGCDPNCDLCKEIRANPYTPTATDKRIADVIEKLEKKAVSIGWIEDRPPHTQHVVKCVKLDVVIALLRKVNEE